MAKCFHCGEVLEGYPFVCKLCNEAHCGKHRLPELHECINVAVYRDTSYRTTQQQKNLEMKMIKSSGSYLPETSSRQYMSTSQLGGTHTTLKMQGFFGEQTIHFLGNPHQAAFLGGMIFGMVLASTFLFAGFLQQSIILLLIASGMTLAGGLGFEILYLLRKQTAQQYGITTAFGIWPLGIAITLITHLIAFTFYTFGFFYDQGGNVRTRAYTAMMGIGSSLGLWLVGRYLLPLLILPAAGISIYLSIFLGILSLTFQQFVWWALLELLPWGILDGKKIMDYNGWYYAVFLLAAIFCFYEQLVNPLSLSGLL